MLNPTHLCFPCADILRIAYTLTPTGGMRREQCQRCKKKRMGQAYEILRDKESRPG